MNTISRILFLSASVTGLAMSTFPSFAQEVKRLRTISYNVLEFRGYPRTAKTRDFLHSQVEPHPELTAQALSSYLPNIITLQEGPAEELVKRLATELSMNYVWFLGGWGGNETCSGGFPSAVITRYPIVRSENRPSADESHDSTLFTRHLGRAELNTPFGRVHVVSTHFHTSDHDVRMQEVTVIVALIEKLEMTGHVLLQGDLNHNPEDPEYGIWTKADLVDVAKRYGVRETPTFSMVKPRVHIDYIWTTQALGEFSKHAEVLSKPPFTPDDSQKTFYGLRDHLPVLVDFDVSELK